MAQPNPILEKMLERLQGALMRGPQLNCSPHGRRQRFDLNDFHRLEDVVAEQLLIGLLDDGGRVATKANVPSPPLEVLEADRRRAEAIRESIRKTGSEGDPEPRDPRVEPWERQQKLLVRLRHLSEDTHLYAQATGVQALEVGFPLLSLPPGSVAGGKRRILAPIAFIGCSMTIRSSGRPGIELECRARDVERVVPNTALFAWLGRELGTSLPEDLFADEAGEEPWREIAELSRLVVEWLELRQRDPETGAPRFDLDAWTDPARLRLEPIPQMARLPNERRLLPSAVLGLFPASNQGLLRDTQTLLERDEHDGPIRSFLYSGTALDTVDESEGPRDLGEDRLLMPADPWQARAIRLARHHRGLVVHGPPGTGKSQTIANMIGDHLARGERVLFVCDKRTALDVVANRLWAIGLGDYCAVVHDPHRDRVGLFMKIRQRLDALSGLEVEPRIEKTLADRNHEIRTLHQRLSEVHRALFGDEERGDGSFHQLAGRWLLLDSEIEQPLDDAVGSGETIGQEVLDAHRLALTTLFERGRTVDGPRQPWLDAAGGTLQDLMALPVVEIERRLNELIEVARRLDHEVGELVEVPAFVAGPLGPQLDLRDRVADHLDAVQGAELDVRRRVWALDEAERTRLRERLASVEADRRAVRDEALDDRLADRIGTATWPTPLEIARQLLTLRTYRTSLDTWWGFVQRQIRRDGRELLATYGLDATADEAARLAAFLEGVEHRQRLIVVLGDLRADADGAAPATSPDHRLLAELDTYDHLLELRTSIAGDSLDAPVTETLLEKASVEAMVRGLRESRRRAEAIEAFTTAAAASRLLSEPFLDRIDGAARVGDRLLPVVESLVAERRHLEDVHRLLADLGDLPAPLAAAARSLVDRGDAPGDALRALEHRALADDLRALVADRPALAELDDIGVERELDWLQHTLDQRRDLISKAIDKRWIERQRERLLAPSGNKLNSVGAAVRQRLFVRGRRSMKLRQVLKVGRNLQYEDGGGDPLFDLCPVWMCSPETVAQIFPLEALFDVVIFDEASQCRLEEALPVLVRARRVVIAGDPHQLPPTRFFEASVASSELQEIETEDDLFEAQQTDVEDLLAAALQLDVQESYLDVHYRSHHRSLIEFSNEHFYGNRLQALPGHPDHQTLIAPIRLQTVGGVYEQRTNRREAEAVVALIDELLLLDEPPTLGVATFNLAQRDLIGDLLTERAEKDPAFRDRFETARRRTRSGTFEGLFVKNLESVQGDERDHIIISTTYGPDPEGKFYRRFGPLGTRGGGRRLNVLVTRARQKIHLLTSIPRSTYLHEQALPSGGTPSGSWLLFAYLRYAEKVEEWFRYLDVTGQDHQDAQREIEEARLDELTVRSTLVDGVCDRVAVEAKTTDPPTAIERYWGNDGFCVDLVVRRPGQESRGVLIDFSRYPEASDPIEWDLFSTALLRSFGWTLRRLFAPRIVRDPEGTVASLLGRVGTEGQSSESQKLA